MPLQPPQTSQVAGPVAPVEIAVPKRVAVKVLLLEDRSDFRNVLREHLISCGYQVISVASGSEGLRKVMTRPVDIILCDMMMPNMGGEMFYWAVTRVRPGARPRFIFFTGHKNNPSLEFFFRRVHARVLYKPFKLSELEAAIREVLLKVA
jgi:CheY-like chemotaxis protein